MQKQQCNQFHSRWAVEPGSTSCIWYDARARSSYSYNTTTITFATCAVAASTAGHQCSSELLRSRAATCSRQATLLLFLDIPMLGRCTVMVQSRYWNKNCIPSMCDSDQINCILTLILTIRPFFLLNLDKDIPSQGETWMWSGWKIPPSSWTGKGVLHRKWKFFHFNVNSPTNVAF